VKFLFLDTETRSRVDINRGTDLYTRSAQCMIVTYALSFEVTPGQWMDWPTKIWQPWQGTPMPADLAQLLADSEVFVVAHNAAFDRAILDRALNLPVPVERWWCTMAQANAHGLPGSLETLGEVCGLPADQQKLRDGYALIDTFCSPQAATDRFIEPHEQPENWQRFCDYAVRDTDAMRAIFKKLPRHNYNATNIGIWHLDQMINERGFGFDKKLATAACEFLGDAKVVSDAVVEHETGGEVHAASQRERLLRYLREKCAIDIESMRASEVREWLERDDLEPTVRLLLEQRLEAGKSSGAKYRRGLEMVGPEDRQRHCFRFNGAGRTGRHSGRGFQPHNMARPALSVRRDDGRIEITPVKAEYIDNVIIPGIYSKVALRDDLVYGGPFEAAALALRHVIVAAPGNELVVGDFKNIESVITAWCAGESTQVQAFLSAFENPKDKSKDVYRILAGKMLGKPPHLVNDTERQMGKVTILAFGFGGGVGALVNMAIAYQMDLTPLKDIVLPVATEEQKVKAYRAWKRAFLVGDDYELDPKVFQACDILKQVYRSTNDAIDQMRKDVDNAVREAVRYPGQRTMHAARCTIWSTGSFLIIELPSGRRLLYAAPKIETEVIEDPTGGEPWISEYVSYATARGRRWRRERAWSGLFVENIVQGIANDGLRAAMLRVHKDALTVPAVADYLATLPPTARTAISIHVHDEVGLDVPKGSYPKERLARVMTQREPWMEGLPMAADTWSNQRYGKR
jgi:DNA polymerase